MEALPPHVPRARVAREVSRDDETVSITQEAFEAIAGTLPLGDVGYEAELDEKGERLIVMVGVGLGYIVTDAI